jgi:hypothetical protein
VHDFYFSSILYVQAGLLQAYMTATHMHDLSHTDP